MTNREDSNHHKHFEIEWRLVVLYLFVIACTLAVYAYTRNSISDINTHHKEDCTIQQLLASNQRFVLSVIIGNVPDQKPEAQLRLAKLLSEIDRVCDP